MLTTKKSTQNSGRLLRESKDGWKFRIEDKHWNRLLKCDGELLVALNLAEASVKSDTPKKRGRPRKELKAAELGESISTPKRRPGRPRVRPIIYGPPRPRGRPRK